MFRPAVNCLEFIVSKLNEYIDMQNIRFSQRSSVALVDIKVVINYTY